MSRRLRPSELPRYVRECVRVEVRSEMFIVWLNTGEAVTLERDPLSGMMGGYLYAAQEASDELARD